jgi:nucleoside-diphosphate-sugar epimerase
MKKICVTGANGFIGKSVCEILSKSHKSIRGIVRNKNLNKNLPNIEHLAIGDISHKTNWKNALEDVDCIIHCAGKAHVMNETKTDELKIYRSVNVDGTRQLAEQAAESGVRRLIFLSSVKVNGEDTNQNSKNKIFTHNDIPDPKNPYSISKYEAEKILWEVSLNSGLEVTIVRLPLVYGKNAKGNLERLIKLVKSQIPLPLSLIKNKRSMIGIDNLVNLLICCIDHPDAVGKTFLVSDGKDLSTPNLIKYIALSFGFRARLFPFPKFLLYFLAGIFGKQKEINRLIGSLVVDSNYVEKTLGWTPSISVEEGIRRMVREK